MLFHSIFVLFCVFCFPILSQWQAITTEIGLQGVGWESESDRLLKRVLTGFFSKFLLGIGDEARKMRSFEAIEHVNP